MCGIAGIIDPTLDPGELQTRLAAMQARLRHRGPDDEGLYVDAQHGVGLAHTRLSILDLSPAGAQPMPADEGRYTITFNGEIYNFEELRNELVATGVPLKSRSDTEVILEMYRREGEACVERFVGMFAFAIWDRRERRCFLARGPMGIKPLYVWRYGAAVAFTSEIRALLEADLGPRRLCSRALRGYLMYGAVQEPLTLVEGIEALPAGHTMVWQDGQTRVTRFAQLEFGGAPGPRDMATTTARRALESSVRRHFVSDVPVSIFLSGGVDSTAIVAVARRCGFENLRTFCISFDEDEFNEGDVAARTARHFGTVHHDWRMTARDARELFPRFLAALDQPSIDGFNTFCVSKLAHDQGAKVVLSGLGGDELFGGYRSFQDVPRMRQWHRRLRMSGRSRAWAGAVAERYAPQNRWQRAGVFLKSGGGMAAAHWAMRGIFTPAEADRLVAHYLGAARVGFAADPFGAEPPELATEADQVGFLESTRYMQNQLLRDSDVMSMAWGLELRVPFVDKRLSDEVGRIAAADRLAAGKRLLLDAAPEIPPWVAQAPKRGFSFPFEKWLGGEWGPLMAQIDRASPVHLGSWYRRWALFALDHFLRDNRISAPLAA
jgi:asparagine synthase (glutamine-hydrolysing)